jgi:ABC-type transport system involved in multi-copper enzyme maturation permease subunit
VTEAAVAGFALPDFRQVRAVAEKEFMDNVRGKWVLALSLIFIILSLVVSYFGATQSGGAAGMQGFRQTGVGIVGLTTTLVPILALMLTYATIAGERESGALQLLLTMPVTRAEVVLGKLVGLTAVMCVSILAGLGVAGLIIGAAAGTDGWDGYAAVVLGTVLFAFSFAAVGLFFSSLVAKRSTALGLAVFLWFFFTIIYGLVMFGAAALAGVQMNVGPGGVSMDFPGWWWALDLVNPGEAMSMFAARSLGFSDFAGVSFGYPDWATSGLAVAVMVVWAVVPSALALMRLHRQDL